MLHFLTGFAILPVGILLWNLAFGAASANILEFEYYLTTLLVAPGLAAGVTLAWLNRRRPRWCFEQNGPRWMQRVHPGVWAGILTQICAAGAILLADSWLPDGMLTAAGALPATIAVFLLLSPVRPGHCLHCDYDLCQSLGFGRCPECGQAIEAGLTAHA